MYSEDASHSEKECIALFKATLHDLEAIRVAMAPDGWDASPLFYIAHPTPQQRYDEALRIHNNLASLAKDREKPWDHAPPTLDDFLVDADDKEIKPLEELSYILGACLWDIFSNNHEVVSADGNVYHIGSFRGSGGFIAEFFNQHTPVETRYDYLDFYMGTIFVAGRADLSPVYEWIFRQLKALGCDWIYHFPRMYLFSFDKPEADETPDGMATYDPAESMKREIEKKEREEETARLREQLDEAYEKAVEKARHEPLPRVVHAYKNVYGTRPEGWPHR